MMSINIGCRFVSRPCSLCISNPIVVQECIHVYAQCGVWQGEAQLAMLLFPDDDDDCASHPVHHLGSRTTVSCVVLGAPVTPVTKSALSESCWYCPFGQSGPSRDTSRIHNMLCDAATDAGGSASDVSKGSN